MRIGALMELLSDIQENHGDLFVRVGSANTESHDVTGIWVRQDEGITEGDHPFVKLVVPTMPATKLESKRVGW